jgi:hypothetical protein
MSSDVATYGEPEYEITIDKRRRFAAMIIVHEIPMFATGRRADVSSYKFPEYEDPEGRTRAAEYRTTEPGSLPVWAFADGTVLKGFVVHEDD